MPLTESPDVTRAPHTAVLAGPRLLGTLGMIASPMLLLEGPLSQRFGAMGSNFWMGLCSLLYVLGWMCSLVGLRWLRATGDGLFARFFFWLQLVGLGLAAVWAAYYIVVPGLQEKTGLLQVTDAAWPLSHILMLVLGGLLVGAKRLRGWRRFPPFLCGLALPVFIVMRGVGAPGAVMSLSFPVLTTLGFFLLGLAVRTSADSTPGAAP